MAYEYNDFEKSLVEIFLDKLSDKLIQSGQVDTDDVSRNQKFIRNGQFDLGAQNSSDILALFQKDFKANEEDLNKTFVNNDDYQINLYQIAIKLANEDALQTVDFSIQGYANDTFAISIVTPVPSLNGVDISDIVAPEEGNPLNVSQFISLEQSGSVINVEQAEEYLDTNIYELLPTGDTRQGRINRFFQELNALLPPTLPNFDQDDELGVDRDDNDNWIGAEQYSKDNSISYAQDNPEDSLIGEKNAFIHRLTDTANSTNSTRTIEEIYRTVRPYLTDILEGFVDEDSDGRPEYQNQSSGYLKFRELNQGIIVRNTNQEFIDGLNPNNPTWLTNDYNGFLTQTTTDGRINFIRNNPGTGFTVTMWVKFLDKVSQGTLFNYGNPVRPENAFGFRLETFVLNKDDTYIVDSGVVETFGDYLEDTYHQNTLGIFQNTNTERFVRLQVREFGDFKTGTDEGLRDSAVGQVDILKNKYNPPDLIKNQLGHYKGADERRLVNYTNIPEDFNEWYFICATYNAEINEDGSDFGNSDADYWLNHLASNGTYVTNSGLGNKCKVEIISRSDLLRARGFKG
tara:strand:+ start:49 stop:1764 length:1716 start_codon:yes stop_codon:yes gene_type:complete